METLKNLTLVQWIGIMVGLNSLLMGATPQLTVLLGAAAVPYIIAIATLGNGALGVFVTVVGGQSTQVRNVLAMPGVEKIAVNGQANAALASIAVDPGQNKISPTPSAMAKVTETASRAMVLFAILMCGLLMLSFLARPGPAMAQSRTTRTPAPAARPIICDPANILPGCKPAAVPTPSAPSTASDPLAKFMDDLANVQQDVVTGVINDIKAADADASTLLNPSDPTSFKDPISHACYPAEVKFLESLPVATAPTGKFVLVQLFQKKRDFVMQIQAGLPVYLKLGCAPLLGDEVAIFTKSMSLIGVSIAANTLLPGSGLLLPPL
jgi:hypothetical protein